MDAIKEKLSKFGQEHVIKYYGDLAPEQKENLINDIDSIDWQDLKDIFKDQVSKQFDSSTKRLKTASKIDDNLLKPLDSDCMRGTATCEINELEQFRNVGLTHIGQGKVAALLLSGGQGTRLGVDYPKGMYDVGLPSQKTLFQLQAERILELSKPLELATGQKEHIFWYIMTSEATMTQSKQYFEKNNYFGLNKNKVIFFEQNTMPCLSFDGKVLLDQKYRVARAPNGNGGIYEALHQTNLIEHMSTNGVEHLHVYCVDNILVRVCDPIFIGYCITKQAAAGAKCVEKVLPNEAVGTICKVNDQIKVIEYSEISDSIAQQRDLSTGKLIFNAGNICEHYFQVDFLKTIGGSARQNQSTAPGGDKPANSKSSLRYHMALKKIPYVDLDTGERVKPSAVNGIKLEKFIFDVFELCDANKFVAWQVNREDEFSPLKNSDDQSERDNPTTARKALLRSYRLGLLTS